MRYDNLNVGAGTTCPPCSKTLTIPIEEDMNKPVFFYYKLTNFYQNHRRYVKSRSDKQLRAEAPLDTKGCDPLETYSSAGSLAAVRC